MPDDQTVLEYCDPSFVEAWHLAPQTKQLSACFIDAGIIVCLHSDDTAELVLATPEWEALVLKVIQAAQKPSEAQSSYEKMRNTKYNFFMLIERMSRMRLIDACHLAAHTGDTEYIDITWRVKSDKVVSIITRIALQKVGQRDTDTLFYFAVRDASRYYQHEENTLLQRYVDMLSAIFNEIFVLDIDTGNHAPLYLNGKPIAGKDGTPLSFGFYEISRSLHPDDRKMFWTHANYNHISRELFGKNDGKAPMFDLRRIEKDGNYHWCSMQIVRIDTTTGSRRVLVCLRNIDQQMEAKRRERELRSKAETDSLTGILNRGTTEELVMAKLGGKEKDSRAYFVLIDVDDFKTVNDSYGHIMGDTILQGVAKCLKDMCQTDDIVGRLGGDEFAALLMYPEKTALNELQNKLIACRRAIAEMSQEAGMKDALTISAGVVLVDAQEFSFHDIYKKADALLYETKGGGKNGYRLYQP